MAKDTFYFPHDYEPTSDPKIQALLGEYGAAGYGLYWRIVEMLHSSQEHRLATRQYLVLAIARQMLSTTDFVSRFIHDCIHVFELFEQEGDMIFSKRVFANIRKREDIRAVRQAAGSKGGKAKNKQLPGNPIATTAKGKETKTKKSKEAEAAVWQPPTQQELAAYFADNGFAAELAERVFKYYTELGWHTAEGKPIRSWKAQMQSTWFRPQHRIPAAHATQPQPPATTDKHRNLFQ